MGASKDSRFFFQTVFVYFSCWVNNIFFLFLLIFVHLNKDKEIQRKPIFSVLYNRLTYLIFFFFEVFSECIFFGNFFSLLLISFSSLNAQSVQNIKHSVFVFQTKAFLYKFQKLALKRSKNKKKEKNGPIIFAG